MENEKVEITYNALSEKERREVESIRSQYSNEVDTYTKKMERLKKLDNFVKNSATCIGLVLGVIGLLVFGFGITCVLEWQKIVLGVIVGFIGVLIMSMGYPAYVLTLKINKKKYGEEILKLSEELLKNN